jgi:hypothetical protein
LISKLLPGHETVILVPATEVNGVPQLLGATMVPYTAPTSAILNKYIPITSNGVAGSGSGGNVSCALSDDLNLGLSDSDTSDERTICSTGQSQALTFYNFDAEFRIFRDIDTTDNTSEFNLAVDLTRAADIPYIIAHRIGYPQTALAAPGQEWDFYYAWTNNPVPDYADGENQAIAQTFISKSIVNVGYTLLS